MKLLVVDDNDIIRNLQSSILAGEGYDVSVASNGLEALTQINQSRPDIIITDILMPVMDGYELCRKVRGDKELRAIPFVFYSAHYLDEKDKKMAMDLGVSHFIQKPMASAEFLRMINGIIEDIQSHRTATPVPLGKEDSELEQDHEQRLTQMLSGKLAELEESQEMLMKALKGTIDTVAMAVEARDPFTAGHQRRVAKLAEAIAMEMGMDEMQVEGIRIGAGIHDIGKIKLPAEILGKPASFSEVEYSIVKEHPLVGHDILKGVEFPWPVADIAYQHHERLDGSGYPQGLKGGMICMEARIVAVADVVEAMLSHRPYRPAWELDEVLAEVESGRGRLFDAQAVDACLQLFRDKGFAFDPA